MQTVRVTIWTTRCSLLPTASLPFLLLHRLKPLSGHCWRALRMQYCFPQLLVQGGICYPINYANFLNFSWSSWEYTKNMLHFATCFVVVVVVVRSVYNYQKDKGSFPFKKPGGKITVAPFFQEKQSGVNDSGTVANTQSGVLDIPSRGQFSGEENEGLQKPKASDGRRDGWKGEKSYNNLRMCL